MNSSKLLKLLAIFIIAIFAQACSHHGNKSYGKKSNCSYYKLKEKCEKGCKKSCSKMKDMEKEYSCSKGKKGCDCKDSGSCECTDCEDKNGSCSCASKEKSCGSKKKNCGCEKKSCSS